MGEIAEMMLDGTLCEGCGEYIGDGGWGIPRYCSPECAAGRGADFNASDDDGAFFDSPPPHRRTRAKCELCGKRLKSDYGLVMHMRDKHGAKARPVEVK